MTNEPLEARIASALSDSEVTSVALAELIVETEAAITAADNDAEQARVRALDPTLSLDKKVARAEMEDLAFACSRLRTVLPRLEKRHAKVQRPEEKARWVAQYDALVPRVDALAEELRDTYCEFAPKMADILSRARVLDAEIRRVRSSKPYPECGEPDDELHLYEVELTARGYINLGPHGLSLDRDLVLPDFVTPSQKIWPPYEVPLAVQMAQNVQRIFAAMPLPGSPEYWEARRNAAREQVEQVARQFERQEREADERRRRELQQAAAVRQREEDARAKARAQDQEGG